MAAGIPAFSYAQAAKGEVSQAPTTTPSKTASTEDSVESLPADSKSAPLEPMQGTPLLNGPTSIEPEVQQAGIKAAKYLAHQASSNADVSNHATREHSKAEKSGPPPTAVPSDTLLTDSNGASHEERGSATPNESDSAWEKVSQSSQVDAKSSSKAGSDNGDSRSWEHVPPAIQLKEAPLPAFNIWTKRANDAKIKAQESKPLSSSGALPGIGTEPTTSANLRKPGDLSVDASKRKGATARHLVDERSPTSTAHEPALGSSSAPPTASKFSVIPPPPSDAMSWPTPESAREEDKKKPHEKHEKSEKLDSEKTPTKTHGKEKWVQMPYVPTAIFNTPMPASRRGGRAARGGREPLGRGGVNGGSNGAEKVHSTNVSPSASGTLPPASRGEMGSRPSGSSIKPKRASSAGPSTSTEARRPGDENGNKTISSNRAVTGDGRRVSSSQQNTQRQWSPGYHGPLSENESGARTQQTQQTQQESQQSRTATERRPDLRSHGDSSVHGPPRERGEGRSERGRAGYRGRGTFSNASGSHHLSGQSFSAASNVSQNFATTKTQSYPDPRRESMPNSSTFPNPREPRHGRNNSRSQSIPTSNFGRYPGSNQHLPQLQTDTANMFFPHGPPAVMSAVPYPGYMEHMQLAGLVQMQMEYYFSVDNLCKDMFLRKHMDSQGFVFLDVLQNFNRIKQLTQDAELIRFTCLRSPVIELLIGGDGLDRIRRRGDWQSWVMAKEDRDPSVRNDGPVQLHHPAPLPQPSLMFPYGDPKMMPMSNMHNVPKTAHPGSHYRPESLSFNDPQQPQTKGETPIEGTPVTDIPLSAAVPDFQPSLSASGGPIFQEPDVSATNPLSKGHVSSPNSNPKNTQDRPNQKQPTSDANQQVLNGTVETRTQPDDGHVPSVPGKLTNGSLHNENTFVGR